MTITPVYIRDEICQTVQNKTGRCLEAKRFYEWLWACLIPAPKAFYTLRDLKKFLFVGFYLNVDRNFDRAKAGLSQDIAAYAWKYQDSTDLETFIAETAIAELSRRVLKLRGASRSREPHLRSAACLDIAS